MREHWRTEEGAYGDLLNKTLRISRFIGEHLRTIAKT